MVDDCEEAAGLLASLLKLADHEVAIARDAEQALLSAASFHPDCVILDLALPGVSGLELARRLSAESRGRPLRLIALSGWSPDEYAAAAEAAGCEQYLTKPVDFARLDALLSAN
ncbi:response regulator [Aquabacterium sp. A7-Y]|uniref:response regulator n=1 Tax=Aquabacterium sp. A7-Y TaxID=1349605 RepID=UPI00223CB3B7|nr:response regulator [Aquabacterium sp. A7-Y]MCW7539006.1 response regulator [Aquabacterium sp. A7-Y]